MTIREVTYTWNDEHGDCYDCGAPALFVVAELYWNQSSTPTPPAVTTHSLFCPVCASHHAANGHRIFRLFTDDTDPVTNEEHERLLTELGIEFVKPNGEAP